MEQSNQEMLNDKTFSSQLPIVFEAKTEDAHPYTFDHFDAWCPKCKQKVVDSEMLGEVSRVSSTSYRFSGRAECPKCHEKLAISVRFSSDGTQQVSINGHQFDEKLFHSEKDHYKIFKIIGMIMSAILSALIIAYNMTH